eukprot:gnl/MRDRNA2_/MRDRNA2_86139_c0_seq1.p1 gnl/MRDRNA2_/MRDRNA2_86139_c0~~gnl/MRDRNA2_/MRDRNA2_86139_c0_seq1.p1  ORF type:complete len:387 (+),score=75.95 gnl/MRDRNA2_/MRDRNA2_86139_c0_seq1:83-1243(+)
MVSQPQSSVPEGSDMVPQRRKGPAPKPDARRPQQKKPAVCQTNNSLSNVDCTTWVPQQSISPPNPNALQPSPAQNLRVVQGRTSAINPCAKDSQQILGRKVGQILGSGTYGTVYEAYNVSTGNKEVLKVVSTVCNRTAAFKEVRINDEIPQHPNIIRQFTYKASRTTLYIFMEHGGPRNLYQVQEKEVNKRFELDFALNNIFCDVVNAVMHLHEHDVCHLDIKPNNVIWGADNIMRVADFGNATHISKPMNRPCGCFPFAAPEVVDTFNNKLPYWGNLADTFSMGVLLFELCFGINSFSRQLGWQGLSQDQLLIDPDRRAAEMREILSRRASFLEEQLSIVCASAGFRQTLLSVLKGMLCPDASTRYPLMDIFEVVSEDEFDLLIY